MIFDIFWYVNLSHPDIVQGVTEVSNRDGFGRTVSLDEDATVASSSNQETVDQGGEGQEVFGG